MTEPAPPPDNGKDQFVPAPRAVRLVLFGIMTFLQELMVLTVVPREHVWWRITGLIAAVPVAAFFSLRLKVPPEKPKTPTTVDDLDDRVADLATQALDRADRNGVAWLTVTVTAHSLVAVGLANVGPTHIGLLSTARLLAIWAMALLVLACITLPAAHAIHASVEQARRAIEVASNHARLGKLYAHVFREKATWPRDLLGTALSAFGMMWLMSGLFLMMIATILAVV